MHDQFVVDISFAVQFQAQGRMVEELKRGKGGNEAGWDSWSADCIICSMLQKYHTEHLEAKIFTC